jgi:hypothetical protein
LKELVEKKIDRGVGRTGGGIINGRTGGGINGINGSNGGGISLVPDCMRDVGFKRNSNVTRGFIV